MNYFPLLLLSVLSPLSLKADANSNPGMVQLIIGQHTSKGSPDDPSAMVSDTVVFRFFAAPNAEEASQQLSFYFDWSRIPRREKIVETGYDSWFAPMIFKDTMWSHYVAYLVCTSQKGEWLEVVVNEKTQEKLWIKSGRFVRLWTWTKLADQKNNFTIAVHTTVYEKPDTNSAPVKADVNCFEIKTVKGNWMQISTGDSELCDCYERPRVRKAWVQFKTPEKLNITVNYF